MLINKILIVNIKNYRLRLIIFQGILKHIV